MTTSEILLKTNCLKSLNNPILIAGPCSAESEIQVLETAKALSKIGRCDFFRAGLWKPRTRPGGFEGVGHIGIPWMQEVKKTYKLSTITEVATSKQIEYCLKAEVDAVWIGARTTVNPYLITEAAAALRGSNIPIFIKNPVSPDLELWVGAFERFYNEGLEKLVAVHRGFTTVKSAPFRNAPLWEIPKRLHEIFPNIPMICDPSHIAGNATLLKETALEALKNKIYSGLMIEVHCNPSKALTDSQQQITPEEYASFIERI